MRGLIGMAGSAGEAKGLTSMLPELVMDRLSLLFGYPETRVLRSNHHDVVVLKRILEACEELPAEELTVSRLSKHLGMSRADLRTACYVTTGFRLDEMLTSRRLSDVYRILRGGAGRAGECHSGGAGSWLHAFRALLGGLPPDVWRKAL